MMRYLKYIITITLFLVFSIGIGVQSVSAASQASIEIVAPVSVNVGDSVNVKITLNALDAPVDTARMVIAFPKDLVKAEYVAPGSLFLKQSPDNIIDNGKGVVSWGAFNIMEVKKKGTFATITFKALKSGTAKIVISNDTLLLLGGVKVSYQSVNATLFIQGSEKNTEDAQKITIQSATHPYQDLWYQDSNPQFSWSKLNDKETFLIGLSRDPAQAPTTKTSSNEVTYQNTEEGLWYFSVKPGSGAEIAQYAIHIDRTPPATITPIIDIQGLQDGASLINLQFKTIDSVSSVQRYEIKLDDGRFQSVTSPYTLRDITPASSLITVRAYDAAGNMTENTTTLKPDIATLPNILSQVQQVPTGKPRSTSAMTVALLTVIIIALTMYLWKRIKTPKNSTKK